MIIPTVTTAEYRPCVVQLKKALFHRWTHKSEIVPPSPLRGGHSGGVLSGEFGIIEFEDGTIAEVEPQKIRFIDEKLKEYDFTECGAKMDGKEANK